MKKFIFAKKNKKRLQKYFFRLGQTLKYLKNLIVLRKVKNQNFQAPSRPGVKLFCHVRNEMRRLPFFFRYYRGLGVNEFYVVDNASTDGTLDYLLQQADTHVFITKEEFKKSDFGMRWINGLIHKYSRNQWCLMVDVDEIFIFPNSDIVSLKVLCDHLDAENKSCLKSFFLDMYPDRPILECPYPTHESPLGIFRYFDPISFSQQKGFHGGTQLRAINHQKDIWKCSLVKFSKYAMLNGGHHHSLYLKQSRILGTMLHFSFDASFKERCIEESKREQYARNALKYKGYLKRFQSDPNLNLHHKESMKLEGYQQLKELHLMRSTQAWDAYAENFVMNRKIQDDQNQAHEVLWSFEESCEKI